MRRWQGTAALPIDQIILTLAQDLFDRPADLALAHKLATALRSSARRASRLASARAKRRVGRGRDATSASSWVSARATPASTRQLHKGKVVVATIHKAKGLEWDRVYLMSVNSYDFPVRAGRRPISVGKRWFVRDRLNLPAETLAQLRPCLRRKTSWLRYAEEGAATRQARLDYAAERLRLLYVGITRARRELIVTWNTGKGSRRQQEAAALTALRTWWENR